LFFQPKKKKRKKKTYIVLINNLTEQSKIESHVVLSLVTCLHHCWSSHMKLHLKWQRRNLGTCDYLTMEPKW